MKLIHALPQNTQTLLSLSDVGFTNDTVAAGDLYDSSTGKFGFVDFASEGGKLAVIVWY